MFAAQMLQSGWGTSAGADKKAKEAMVVQRISNTRQLKTMSRKERQKLVTVDEAQVVNPRRRD